MPRHCTCSFPVAGGTSGGSIRAETGVSCQHLGQALMPGSGTRSLHSPQGPPVHLPHVPFSEAPEPTLETVGSTSGELPGVSWPPWW